MPLLCIGGQTATGKTEAAMAVADRFDCVLVSADAMQVYRRFDIGTAKPSTEEQAAYPHRGIDIRDWDQDYNAAEFAAVEHVLFSKCFFPATWRKRKAKKGKSVFSWSHRPRSRSNATTRDRREATSLFFFRGNQRVSVSRLPTTPRSAPQPPAFYTP